MNYLPPLPTPPPVFTRLEALATAPPATGFAGTCLEVARQFEAMARTAYLDGDDARGDALFTAQLRWELAALTNDLTVVRP